jgi:Sec-independent protein secretion pathway component TatC
MWTVQQYYSFVTRFVLGFGLAFELPVVVLALVKFGLVTYQFMARTRPYAIVLIFILATIITPTPDVLTLVALSLPMCLLYESCIWIAWFMQRNAARAGSA